ncbi:MAG: MBOAT family O-acyltransferase [Elusimicrobiota bacterium]
MSFNSGGYFFLLFSVFVLFWGMRRHPSLRLWLLLAASYVFYASWNGLYLVLIFLSTLIDYSAGHLIYAYDKRPRLRRLFLVISVVSNLAVLCLFKYGQFMIDNVGWTLNLLHMEADLPTLRILLPIGVSFYTFQSMSYTLDIYLRRIQPARSARDFFLFVAFFPQLIAGPIVRAGELLPQFEGEPRLTRDDLAQGVYLILRGLAKKMVVADYLAGAVVDPVFNMPHLFNSMETFVALIGFHFQIYCDFSGYTDIAIGSARLFGFDLPQNFDRPYAACTPARFWRRWHMTLTRFAFDYLYVPMGGSRGGLHRTLRNILLTFAVIGLWHGAHWKYVLFGLYHAVGVIGTRAALALAAPFAAGGARGLEDRLEGRVAPIVLTNLFIIFSLPLFRAADLPTAWAVYGRAFSFTGASAGFPAVSLLVLLAAVVAHYVPERVEERMRRAVAVWHPALQGALVVAFAFIIERMALLAQRSFIYFQF